MPEHTTTPAMTTIKRPKTWIRTARWVASFVGFPLGGLAAMVVVGPVDSSVTAVAGGLLTGAVLGTAQAGGLGLRPWLPIERAAFLRWIAATAVGLGVGLGIGSTAVGFGTSLQALVVQGAISGLAVGAGDVLGPRLVHHHLGRRPGRRAVHRFRGRRRHHRRPADRRPANSSRPPGPVNRRRRNHH